MRSERQERDDYAQLNMDQPWKLVDEFLTLALADINKPGDPIPPLPENAGQKTLEDLDKLRFADGSVKTADLRAEMQQTMQLHAAVYRTGDVLQEGCDKIDDVVQKFEDVATTDRSLIWNTDLIETLELRNLLCNTSARSGLAWSILVCSA